MAAEALTAKRRAACCIVLPPLAARTIRSRRSWDKGAVMMNSTALTPQHPGIRTLDSVQARTALAARSAITAILPRYRSAIGTVMFFIGWRRGEPDHCHIKVLNAEITIDFNLE
jgi:hypothetical protein